MTNPPTRHRSALISTIRSVQVRQIAVQDHETSSCFHLQVASQHRDLKTTCRTTQSLQQEHFPEATTGTCSRVYSPSESLGRRHPGSTRCFYPKTDANPATHPGTHLGDTSDKWSDEPSTDMATSPS